MKLVFKMTAQADGTFKAWCPALPGCRVWGHTRQEASRKMHAAVSGYLATMEVALPRELARHQPNSALPNVLTLHSDLAGQEHSSFCSA
ncbi:MAG: hypothetical protein ABFD92_12935 [Planctomycetaceae bacterium]|nr:hypothetical protein [Planctomycetaceae bacterium]